MTDAPLYGMMAEFDNPTELVRRRRPAYAAGYRKMDAYSPFPIEEASRSYRLREDAHAADRSDRRHSRRAQRICAAVLDQLHLLIRLNVGGRPLHSWPAFIILTFEMTMLFGGLSAVIGMLALNGLPMPYHPVFNVDRFSAVTRDKFFLVVEAADSQFDLVNTTQFMESLHPISLSEVPH